MGKRAKMILNEMERESSRRRKTQAGIELSVDAKKINTQKVEITKENYQDRIINTLLEINQVYPELRDRLIDTPHWIILSEIEREINRAALEDDFEGLGRALEAYKQAVLTVEGTGSQGNLFKGLAHERG